MTYPQKNRNNDGRLAAEVRGFIEDAVLSSLTVHQAAEKVLARVTGATPEQLLVAAIDLLREQERRHAETIADLTLDNDCLTDEVAELEALRARNLPRGLALSRAAYQSTMKTDVIPPLVEGRFEREGEVLETYTAKQLNKTDQA